MDLFRREKHDVGGNEHEEPPDFEEDGDGNVEDEPRGEKAPLPSRDPQTEGDAEFEHLRDPYRPIVKLHGEIQTDDGVRRRTRPRPKK